MRTRSAAATAIVPCMFALFLSVSAADGGAQTPAVDASEIVAAYGEAWNTEDQAARRALLLQSFAEAGTYTDPTAHVEGREALVEHIGQFRSSMPGALLEVTSGIDRHHNHLRFSWRITRDGTEFASGIDYGELDESGKLVRIVGFFGPFPEKE